MNTNLEKELQAIYENILAQKTLRGVLPDDKLDASLKRLNEKRADVSRRLAAQHAKNKKRAAVSRKKAAQRAETKPAEMSLAQSKVGGSAVSGIVETQRDFVGRDQITVFAEKGAKVVFGETGDLTLDAIDLRSGFGKYLEHMIARNRYLQLQGIRSGGRLVHIELEHIYITLRTTQKRTVTAEEAWLKHEAARAPGEVRKQPGRGEMGEAVTETVTVSVNKAMADNRRLVVLGDPGSGKTTLLRHLALLYARDLAEKKNNLVADKLNLFDTGLLPILLPLRQIGAYLQKYGDESVEGHVLLLNFLYKYLANERIQLRKNFFDHYLEEGRAIVLLDGMDEVAGPDLRRRVARLVNSFTRAYPYCRFIVTSRIVGYTGSARLSEEYKTTTVQDFNLIEVEKFLSEWHRLVAMGQMGVGQSANQYAAEQTRQLMRAIRGNLRIRELAINPLMLTVIALVHRDRVKLPDRRAELYAEAIDVLLGKWDQARGVTYTSILTNKPFDTGDRRVMLQTIALHMHESQLKEIDDHALRQLLFQQFNEMVPNSRAAVKAVDRFLRVIRARTGLLVARGDGVYAFSHLTFQEYLAALAMMAQVDAVNYVLAHTAESWWREAILLAVGHLSMSGKERTTQLIQAIADQQEEPEPYHNLVLAAECLRDAGSSRVQGNLEAEIQQRLQADIEMDLEAKIAKRQPGSRWEKWWRGVRGDRFNEEEFRTDWIQRKIAAATALGRLSGYEQRFWKSPFGEPEWVEIPAGKFMIGSNEGREDARPQHILYLDTYQIARVPVTNAQYLLFVKATNHRVPYHWKDSLPPKGLESHPVINVSWHDAMAYCRWLSQAAGKNIVLPSEVEWEKAARGSEDARIYPWGDTFDRMQCNSKALGIGSSTPVGIFPNGASPYGVLDMTGNVWEWTRSLYRAYDLEKLEKERKLEWTSSMYRYPYRANDGREDVIKGDEWTRVVRGGAWYDDETWLGCAIRYGFGPSVSDDGYGFRVCVSSFSLSSDLLRV
ncbi:MAG: SUMF1/EgtB/PvdO family nonheme iron enzyme [Chloroflexi bacterium]|nr:SUMF1/EgtB/PvdO family nonheme iron enzyme [Chloroflexota bacterium]